MLRGYYTAGNAIINEQRVINVKSNNMANLNTAGYKADTAIPTTFAERMLLINGETSETGTIRYRTIENTFTNLEEGSYENTNSRLDLATYGNIYFNIEESRTGEILLTKNGQFDIDAEGFLSLGTSGRVVDDAGNPIQLATADFTVSDGGEITTADGRIFQLGLSYLEEGSDVEKVGNNLIRPYEEAPIGNVPADYSFTVRQGWYERSNVDSTKEMVQIMSSQSVYTACSTALKIINEVNRIATNDLAKI